MALMHFPPFCSSKVWRYSSDRQTNRRLPTWTDKTFHWFASHLATWSHVPRRILCPRPPAPPPNLPLGFLPFQRICDSITNFLEPLRGRRWATKHPIYFNLPRIFSFKLNEWIQVKNSSNFSKNKFPIFKWFNSIFLKRMKRFIFEKRPLIDGRKKGSTWSISATTSFHAGVWHLFISGQGPFFTADVGSFFRPLTVGHQWKHQTLGIF